MWFNGGLMGFNGYIPNDNGLYWEYNWDNNRVNIPNMLG